MAKLKHTSLSQVDRSLVEEFDADLTDLVERYVLRGLQVEHIGNALEKHSSQIVTAVAWEYVNMAIKVFVVGTCTVTPIWMLQVDKHDPWLYGTMLLSYLAVVMQFFDLDAVVELVRKLKKGKLI